MGSAFIAIADDATAASWNPGGLCQLKYPEISFVGTAFHRIEDNKFSVNTEASGSQSISQSNINYLSATYPFTFWNRNMIFSVNYQNLFDFTRNWSFPLKLNLETLVINMDVDYVQEGSLSAYGIAYGIQITPKILFGLTLNIWEDGIYRNEWKQKIHQKGSINLESNTISFEYHNLENFSFRGLNLNLGFLWRCTDHLTLGTVLKTPFKADLKHEAKFSINYPEYPEANAAPVPSISDEKLDMPISYGIGLSYRFSDEFTVCMDIYRTEWGEFILTDPNGIQTSPISGLIISESDIDPTCQIRMGVEYLFITNKYIFPLRGGLFYDPAPAEGNPDDFFGFTLGSGIAAGRFIFDIAYQYRFGNGVGASLLQNLDFSQDIDEYKVYSSVIIHF